MHKFWRGMENDGLAQIVAALEVVHQSSSTNQQRREAQGVSCLGWFFFVYNSLLLTCGIVSRNFEA